MDNRGAMFLGSTDHRVPYLVTQLRKIARAGDLGNIKYEKVMALDILTIV
jgi:hypothetical protein